MRRHMTAAKLNTSHCAGNIVPLRRGLIIPAAKAAAMLPGKEAGMLPGNPTGMLPGRTINTAPAQTGTILQSGGSSLQGIRVLLRVC